MATRSTTQPRACACGSYVARAWAGLASAAPRLACAWWIPAALVVAGCHAPQSVERQQRRYDRIAATIEDARKRDERRPRQIEWLVDTAKRQEAERDEHLQGTLRRISDRYDRDVYYLHHGDPLHKARFERNWNRQPENIPDVWSRLVY